LRRFLFVLDCNPPGRKNFSGETGTVTSLKPAQENFPVQPAAAGNSVPKDSWIILIITAVFVIIAIAIGIVFMLFWAGIGGNCCGAPRSITAIVQQPDPGTIIVTYQGGADADKVQGMNVTIINSSGLVWTKMAGRTDPTFDLLPVGANVSFSGEFSGNDHAIATAHFTDGSNQILLDKTI
jgi:hypothetical protein